MVGVSLWCDDRRSLKTSKSSQDDLRVCCNIMLIHCAPIILYVHLMYSLTTGWLWPTRSRRRDFKMCAIANVRVITFARLEPNHVSCEASLNSSTDFPTETRPCQHARIACGFHLSHERAIDGPLCYNHDPELIRLVKGPYTYLTLTSLELSVRVTCS